MQYLSVQVAGQALAVRPLPAAEYRHQAATVRRRSPPQGECTPQSSPPLPGSQTPGVREVKNGSIGRRVLRCHHPALIASLQFTDLSLKSQPHFRWCADPKALARSRECPGTSSLFAAWGLSPRLVLGHLTLKRTSPRLQHRQVRRRKMKASRPEQEMRTTA